LSRIHRAGRVAAATILVLLLGVSIAACGSSSGASSNANTLIVGVPRNFGYLSTLWARNIQPAGVHVEYKYFPVFTDMLTALNSGKIDITEIGDVGAVQSYVNGGTVRAVAVTQPNSANCGLIVPKGSTATSLSDLKGKKIIFLKSTNSYIMFLHQIKQAGLKQSDFDIVQIAGPAANKAFQTGQVAGYYTIDPNLSDIVAQTGARVVATCAQEGVQNLYPYVATNAAIKSKPKAIAAFVQAIADNIAWIQTHPKQQAALVAPKLGFSQAAIETTYARGAKALLPINDSFYTSEQAVVSELVSAGIVAHSTDVKQVFLPTFNADITPSASASQ
jgi:sulfonate transport system substrate-binding protein